MKGRVEIMKELFGGGSVPLIRCCLMEERLFALAREAQPFGSVGVSLQWLEDRQVSINSKDGHGNTILHLAVAKRHIQSGLEFIFNEAHCGLQQCPIAMVALGYLTFFEHSAEFCSFHNSLEEDPLALERTITSSSETPLHIARMLGHVEFAREILSRKPELALELDSEGFSPLHLASARKNIEMDSSSFGGDERPSRDHERAVRWRPGALDKVLFDGGEIVLALAREARRLEALAHLQWLEDRQVSINSKDGHGNTILHLASG
ncbi:hypothetical protein Syun_030864 [Stephania yunnanensis]|uniref:Uncharacterized protein n=1 Tax=Stephania yunnanensis TaxID=152371 RepID=A0AAP0HG12_9MAGN